MRATRPSARVRAPRSRHHPPMKVRDPVLRIVTAMLTACFGRSVLRLAFVSAVAVRRQATAAASHALPRRRRRHCRRVAVARDERPARNVMRPPGWKAIASLTVVAGIATRSAGAPGSTSDGARPTARRARDGDCGDGVVGQEVRGHDHQGRRLERVAPSHRVERILQVVGAGGDVRRPQCATPRSQSAPRGMATWWSRPCRNRFVCGSATTLMPAAATASATRRCTDAGCTPEAHTMAGRDRWWKPVEITRMARSSSARVAGSSVSSVCRSSGSPARRGDRRATSSVASIRIGVEVGAAADEVDPGGDGVAKQRPVSPHPPGR